MIWLFGVADTFENASVRSFIKFALRDKALALLNLEFGNFNSSAKFFRRFYSSTYLKISINQLGN